ncbi:MAG: DNA polymerase III subunit beta [Erysipelotrichaceae bacterium]|nr:DNA polymerase III subunit beta [Erysipelotrichaceae bacterium]
MNFKISKSVLYDSLQLVSKAISNNSPLPALSGIKIDVEQDKIILTGSDAEISIKKELNNEKYEDLNLIVISEGSIVIEARYLLEIVRKIDSSEISFEIVDGSLIKIIGKATEYKINGMRSSDYPSIDFNKPNKSFNIDSSVLVKIINQTAFAASDKEIRPVLTGVNFKIKDGVMECVSTDSYRLAKKIINIDTDLNINVTIPAKSLYEIVRAIESNELISIALDDKKAQFYVDSTLIQTRLIDGSYPETNRLIPTEFKNVLVVEARDIINAIDRAVFIKNEGVSIVKLSLSKEEAVISSKSQEVGSLQEVLNFESYEGDNFNISFSGSYMLDAIRYLGSNKVRINFAGEMKPFIIDNPDDSSIIQLVLPVRTYN